MKDSFFLAIGILFVAVAVLLFWKQPVITENKVTTVKIHDYKIAVEQVDTPNTRERGLSGREVLLPDTGMLFVFENPDVHGFWMKEMKFAIDIVWIDEHFKVIGIDKGLTPDTYPKTFYPNQAVKYVLELPSGASEKYHIDIGDIILLEA